jgi:RNA polymerase sigma factor (sigma-70 family)
MKKMNDDFLYDGYYDENDEYSEFDDSNYDYNSEYSEDDYADTSLPVDDDDENVDETDSDIEIDENELNEISSQAFLLKKSQKREVFHGEPKTSIDKYYNSLNGQPDDVRNRFYAIMEDYHSGDEYRISRAKEEALKSLEGFIYTLIKRSYSTYAKKHFADLLQEGRYGVLVGLDKYVPDKGMPTTFFSPYIKHEMQLYVTKLVDNTTTHYSSNIKKINKAIEYFEERNLPYTPVDIAIQTKMTVETVNQSLAIRNYRDVVHIDACPQNSVPNLKTKDKTPTPEEVFFEREEQETLYRCIEKYLTPLEIQVIEMYFGINGSQTYPEGEISKKLHIPKDKVKRLLNTSQRKLKESELKFLYRDNLVSEDKLIDEMEMPFVPTEMAQNLMDDLEADTFVVTEIPFQ